MNTPKQELYDILSNNWGLATEWKEKADYSTPGALNKVLKDEKKEFEKFYGLVAMIKFIYPNIEDEKEWMIRYTHTLDPNKRTARYMLEYLDINGLHSEKKKLMNRMLNCSNATSKKWVEVYKIDDRYTEGEISIDEALNQLSNFSSDNAELKVISSIFKAYCYLDKKAFNMIKEVLNIEKDFSMIKDSYIRDVLYGKFLLLMTIVSEREGSVELTRNFCRKITKEVENKYVIGLAYVHLGNSYMLENFETSYKYLQKGIFISNNFSKNNFKQLKRSMNFLHGIWGKESIYNDFESKDFSDIHNVVYYYINNEQQEKAKNLLNQIDVSQLNSNELGFNFYLKGLLSRDLDDFCSSVQHFKNSGDMYFRKLPLIELQKQGVPVNVLELLAV